MFADASAEALASELSRLATTRNGWTSTLFAQSSVLVLHELLVAGTAVQNAVLSAASFEQLRAQVKYHLLRDPGFGNQAARGTLANQLPRKMSEFGSRSYLHLGFASQLKNIEASYLPNWARYLADNAATAVGDEFSVGHLRMATIAEYLLAHLLGLGLSPSYLARWLDYRRLYDPRTLDINALADDLVQLVGSGLGDAEALVVLRRTTSPEIQKAEGWLTAQAAKTWLFENGFDRHNLMTGSVHGGIVLRGAVWDLDGLLVRASRTLRSIQDRSKLKTGSEPDFGRLIWVKGVKDPRRLPSLDSVEHRLPGYELPALTLSPTSSDHRLEVAVDFLQSAVLSQGAASAGMLWAAIEGLYGAPGDESKLESGLRAADIATVAFTRFEITNALGATLSKRGDTVFSNGVASTEYRARIPAFISYLRAGIFNVQSPALRLQLLHTASLLERDILRSHRERFADRLTDLYRQRNLVLHGGITDAPLLAGTLRSSVPLVSACINRFAGRLAVQVDSPQAFAFKERSRLLHYLDDNNADLLTLVD